MQLVVVGLLLLGVGVEHKGLSRKGEPMRLIISLGLVDSFC